MRFIDNASSRYSTMRELMAFFWRSKFWWLTPMLLVLLLLAVLIVFAQSSSAVPFLYTIF
jgi:hypothetical protein